MDVTSIPSRRVKAGEKFQTLAFISGRDCAENSKDECGEMKFSSIKHPLNEKIDEDVDYDLRCEFAKFVEWTLKRRSTY